MSTWIDVTYDTDSARRAADLLQRVAGELDARTRSREHLAQQAHQGWSGTSRSGFDGQVREIVARSEELCHRLRRAALTIEDDLNAAITERRRRERRRAELRATGEAHFTPA